MPADNQTPADQSTLRLDLFLKNVGLLKRRSLAQEACRQGAILVDGAAARPGRTLRPGQRIEIRWPRRMLEVEVLYLQMIKNSF